MTGLVRRNNRDVTKHFDRDEFFTPFDKLFDNFFNDVYPSFKEDFGIDFFEKSSYPKCDVIDYEDYIVMNFEIPGLSRDEISIDVDENEVLSISGKKSQDKDAEVDNKRYIRRELKKSFFKRSFHLSSNKYDLDNIKAKFDNGILEVTVPKFESEPLKKRKVDIE